MIGESSLGIVIGADAFTAVARSHLFAAVRGNGVLLLGTLAVVGAVVVTNNAKRIIMKMKEKVGCMMKSMPDDMTDS